MGFLNKNCVNCFEANEHLHTISMKLDDTGDSKYNSDRLTYCGITIAQRNDFENYLLMRCHNLIQRSRVLPENQTVSRIVKQPSCIF